MYNMNEYTLVKIHISVQSVGRHSERRRAWWNMNEYTLVRSHINVQSVGRHSARRETSLVIIKYTLWRSLISVLSVGRSFLEKNILWYINEYTLVRSHISAARRCLWKELQTAVISFNSSQQRIHHRQREAVALYDYVEDVHCLWGPRCAKNLHKRRRKATEVRSTACSKSSKWLLHPIIGLLLSSQLVEGVSSPGKTQTRFLFSDFVL